MRAVEMAKALISRAERAGKMLWGESWSRVTLTPWELEWLLTQLGKELTGSSLPACPPVESGLAWMLVEESGQYLLKFRKEN